jgi:hypothetical protein
VCIEVEEKEGKSNEKAEKRTKNQKVNVKV